MIDTQFITDRQIYKIVVQGEVPASSRFLWLATSDLKHLYVESDRIWMGAECKGCQRKKHCSDFPELLA